MSELEQARALALAAGLVLRERQPGATSRAKPDGSPVSDADLAANQVIIEGLRTSFPGDRVVSEEASAVPEVIGARRTWLVDPLDGTRDYLAGSPEFAVHIALLEQARPVLAVVHHPASGRLYEALAGRGAFRGLGGDRVRLRVSEVGELTGLRVGVSRLAPGPALSALLAETSLGQRAVPMGASVKLTAVAEATLDATLCLHGGEKLWDSCAPALIILEAGGQVTDVDGRSLRWDGPLEHRRGIVTSNGRVHQGLCDLAVRYWERR